jgi:hypothetical protein
LQGKHSHSLVCAMALFPLFSPLSPYHYARIYCNYTSWKKWGVGGFYKLLLFEICKI